MNLLHRDNSLRVKTVAFTFSNLERPSCKRRLNKKNFALPAGIASLRIVWYCGFITLQHS